MLNGTDGSSTNAGGKIQRDDQETASGTFETFDAATNILTLKEVTGTFDDKVTITGSTPGEAPPQIIEIEAVGAIAVLLENLS